MAHAELDLVPVMAFYDLDWHAWQTLVPADQDRMLATVRHFQKIEVRSQDRDAVRALRGWRARLGWVERYADLEQEARRAVCLMEIEPVGALWARLRRDVAAQQHATVDPVAPAWKHPLYWALVELLQRALVTLEIHDELGATGADGVTAQQAGRMWAAAQRAGQSRLASHVPHAVADLLVALKPVLLQPEWCRLTARPE